MIKDLDKLVLAFVGGCLIFALLLGGLGDKQTPPGDAERPAAFPSRFGGREPAPVREKQSTEVSTAGRPEIAEPESVDNPYSDDILRRGLTEVFGEEGSHAREERLRVYREGRFNRYQEQAASSVTYSAPGGSIPDVFARVNAGAGPAGSEESSGAKNPYSLLELREPRTSTYIENAARSRGE